MKVTPHTSGKPDSIRSGTGLQLKELNMDDQVFVRLSKVSFEDGEHGTIIYVPYLTPESILGLSK